MPGARIPRPKSRSASCTASPPISPRRSSRSCRAGRPAFEEAKLANPAFARWAKNNLGPHRADGYAIVNISLKPEGGIPGDATADQMRVMADLAERYSFDELRVSHAQNIVLPHVKKDDVFAVWQALEKADLAAANYGLAGDIIACPGLDYCALATARSIPIAQSISRKFADSKKQDEIGKLKINISGCINACGHHHVGHIGILGLDKKGEEFYQITLGGSSAENASIGTILGPGFAGHEVADAIETILDTYLKLRAAGRGIPRHLPPPRRQALQGGSLCHCLRTTCWSPTPGSMPRPKASCRMRAT